MPLPRRRAAHHPPRGMRSGRLGRRRSAPIATQLREIAGGIRVSKAPRKALERTVGARQKDPAGTRGLDAQFVSRLETRAAQGIHRNSDLILGADPGPAATDMSFLYFLHQK